MDILRGISMLGLVAFHAVDKTMYPGHIESYSELQLGQLLLFGLVFYFGSWRSLFVIISGIANTYSCEKVLQSGENPLRYFLMQLIWSIILLVWGIVIQLFFNPWSGINDYIVTGVFNWEASVRNLMWCDAVETIALSLLITSILQIILSSFKLRWNAILKIIIYALIAIGVFIIWNPLLHYFETQYELIPSTITSLPHSNFKEVNRAFWIGILIGYQQPLIPYLAPFMMGNIIGIIISAPEIADHKIKVIIGGFISAILFVAMGFFLWIFRDHMYFGGDLMIPPDWFFFINTGFQLIVIISFLQIFDFSQRAQKRVRRTKLFRRAGLISLTMFTLQPLDLIPRAFLNLFFEENFIIRGDLDLWLAMLCGLVVFIFWICIIIVWGLVNYTLSIDYIFVILRRLIAGKRIYLKDPLRTKEIIRYTESFMIIKPEKVKMKEK